MQIQSQQMNDNETLEKILKKANDIISRSKKHLYRTNQLKNLITLEDSSLDSIEQRTPITQDTLGSKKFDSSASNVQQSQLVKNIQARYKNFEKSPINTSNFSPNIIKKPSSFVQPSTTTNEQIKNQNKAKKQMSQKQNKQNVVYNFDYLLDLHKQNQKKQQLQQQKQSNYNNNKIVKTKKRALTILSSSNSSSIEKSEISYSGKKNVHKHIQSVQEDIKNVRLHKNRENDENNKMNNANVNMFQENDMNINNNNKNVFLQEKRSTLNQQQIKINNLMQKQFENISIMPVTSNGQSPKINDEAGFEINQDNEEKEEENKENQKITLKQQLISEFGLDNKQKKADKIFDQVVKKQQLLIVQQKRQLKTLNDFSDININKQTKNQDDLFQGTEETLVTEQQVTFEDYKQNQQLQQQDENSKNEKIVSEEDDMFDNFHQKFKVTFPLDEDQSPINRISSCPRNVQRSLNSEFTNIYHSQLQQQKLSFHENSKNNYNNIPYSPFSQFGGNYTTTNSNQNNQMKTSFSSNNFNAWNDNKNYKQKYYLNNNNKNLTNEVYSTKNIYGSGRFNNQNTSNNNNSINNTSKNGSTTPLCQITLNQDYNKQGNLTSRNINGRSLYNNDNDKNKCYNNNYSKNNVHYNYHNQADKLSQIFDNNGNNFIKPTYSSKNYLTTKASFINNKSSNINANFSNRHTSVPRNSQNPFVRRMV